MDDPTLVPELEENAEQDAPARFTLKLTASLAERSEDLIVDAADGDPVKTLTDALAIRLGGDGDGGALFSSRLGALIDANAPLERAGIRWGDTLVLAPAADEPTRIGSAPRAEVIVTGGPCSGQRWMMGIGKFKVGRDPSSEIHLSDPSLSREHALIEVTEASITVTDLNSSNGVAIAGRQLQAMSPRVLQGQDELEMGRSLLRVRDVADVSQQGLVERHGRVEFNRPPRVNVSGETFVRDLKAPPERGRKARLPLTASIVPLIMGVVMFLVLKSPFMLIVCGLSPLMAMMTFVTDRRAGQRSFGKDSADFRSRLTKAVEDLDRALVEEATARRAEAPDLATLLTRTANVDPSVWERRRRDRDFMQLRIGVADLPARSRVNIADGGDPDLQSWADEQLSSRATVMSVPLTLSFPQSGVVGLAGDRDVTEGIARGLVVQATCLHSPGDLVVAAAVSRDAEPGWAWLKWLPHLQGGRIGLTQTFASGRDEAEALIVAVRDLVADRRAQTRTRDTDSGPSTALLLLIDEDAAIDRALISAALSDASGVDVMAVWLGRETRNLPGQTGAIIEAADKRSQVTVTDVSSGQSVNDVTPDGLDNSSAESAARALAPIHDIGHGAQSGDLPSRISLLELLQLSPATPSKLQRRWTSWSGRLDATIGLTSNGPLTVDLRADGPHALIAGTTGSGKSELLRTLVAAAAASVPPDRLMFLLIDYKGGSAFAPCAAFPHVVDVISDLDEHLAERALISLEAELRRRERILAEFGARDLVELQRRAGTDAPPMLVIAVDEFAKLRDEVPSFVDGVVDIAQRGRSLGVHMVLAAQSLRNAFTPAIRANTNLRVALRVAEDTESDDVIASSAAARIPSGDRYRGRGFARTGHAELLEFQAAYVSGRTLTPERHALELAPFTPYGSAVSGDDAAVPFDTDDDSDLTALATIATEVQALMELPAPTPPWLPALPELLDADELPPSAQPGCAAIGLVDLPHLQRQDPLIIDLPTIGNVAVFGAGGSGKSTLLATTALALARAHTPDEMRIYGIGTGGGALNRIAALPHCGGVVSIADEERIARLMRQLVERIESARSETASESDAAIRRTVLLLDDLGSFMDSYDKPGLETPYEHLQRVLSSGRAAGVHVILTAARRAAVSNAVSAHIGQRLVLRMPTDEELLALGLDGSRVRGAKLPTGRGFTQGSDEFQVAVPTDRDGRIDYNAHVVELASRLPDATRLGTLPTIVPMASVVQTSRAIDQVPIGIADSNLQTATIDLSDSHFLVVGAYRSGRSTTLATLATAVSQLEPAPKLWALAPRRSPLRELGFWSGCATTGEACAQAIAELAAAIASRDEDAAPMFVFIDDGGELGDPMLSATLERAIRAGRDRGVMFIAAVETSAARGIAIPWIRELRKDGHGFLLQPDLLADGDLLGARLPRRVAAPMVPGRGFIVSRGQAQLVQVAR